MLKNLDKEDKISGQSNSLSSQSLYEERNIVKFSEEWRFVEYHLKSSINSEADIKRIITISNQHMIINFEKRAKNKLYTYAWYNLKGLGEDANMISKLRSRGFEISPDTGLDFVVGSLSNDNSEDGGINEESTYVLCKIIIGRSYCKINRDKEGFSSYAMENSFKKIKPAGYDSVMFCPADWMSNKSSRSGWGASKSFVYRIFDSTNVLPIYWVCFSPIDLSTYTFSSKHICGECESKEADFYCHNCEEYICSSCYDNIHGESDKNSKEIFAHKKDVLTSKIKTGKCVFDPDKNVEFYCTDCKLTICSYCRVIGSHSKGEAASHVLENIEVAHRNHSPENIETIKIAEDRKKKALDHLKILKEHINNLKNVNMTRAIDEIDTAFEQENQRLQAKSLESMLAHLSIMNELLVIKDTINWFDKYFTDRENYLRENNNQAEFIWVWNHHNRILQEIMHNKSLANTDYKVDSKDFDNNKMTELKIFHYRFEETNNFKEQNKEDNNKKLRDGKKG